MSVAIWFPFVRLSAPEEALRLVTPVIIEYWCRGSCIVGGLQLKHEQQRQQLCLQPLPPLINQRIALLAEERSCRKRWREAVVARPIHCLGCTTKDELLPLQYL